MKKIIGIIGPVAAGKDTAAKYIARKSNISIFQISEPLRKIAASRGLEPTRDNLIVLGRELASEKGPAYLVEVIFPEVPDIAIITGMRQLAQIEYLKKHADLSLIAIDAPLELRFARAKVRGKLGEGETLKQFTENEQRENNGLVQRLFDCMRMADYTIVNSHSIRDLETALDATLKDANIPLNHSPDASH